MLITKMIWSTDIAGDQVVVEEEVGLLNIVGMLVATKEIWVKQGLGFFLFVWTMVSCNY